MKLTLPSSTAVFTVLGLVVLNAARAQVPIEQCDEGLTLWQRGVDVAFCAARCVADVDCLSGIERCRLIDPEAGPDDPPILIDDAPEILAVYAAEGREVFGLCDPFFDVEGVVDDVVVEQTE